MMKTIETDSFSLYSISRHYTYRSTYANKRKTESDNIADLNLTPQFAPSAALTKFDFFTFCAFSPKAPEFEK